MCTVVGLAIIRIALALLCHRIVWSFDDEVFSKLNIPTNPHKLVLGLKLPASVEQWGFLDKNRKISLLSMVVDHHSDGSWYMPSLHEKYSIGWNRTVEKGFMNRPHACNIRFYGVGLASHLEGFEDGGTGYLIIGQSNGKFIWHGIDVNHNETSNSTDIIIRIGTTLATS